MNESLVTAELSRYPTATLYEASGRRGAMDSAIKPLTPGLRLAGAAYTVRCAPNDNLAVHRALEQAPAGSVLVIDTAQGQEGTYCGEIMVLAARARGIAGIVLDAHVRDSSEIREMGYPVFCRGAAIRGAHKNEAGALQVPIVCGNVHISPGDIIVGDDDGAIVIPSMEASAVLDAARERDEWERFMMRGVSEGRTTLDLLGRKGETAHEE